MLAFKEVPVIDKNAEFRGVPAKELMENAGRKLAQVILDEFSERSVLFICGTGNNGGDAYVAARRLRKTWKQADIMVHLVKNREEIRSDIAAENFKKFQGQIIADLDWPSIDKKTIIVDAMLGTGVKGKIREPYRSVIEKINDLENPVISVDVPSGLGADIKVKPQITVTFHDVKEGMTGKNSGEIEIKDIGIPQKAINNTGPGELLLYPRSQKDSHKGENGRLLIIGGGPYTGAPALAAKAAYRTGVDLVHLAVPSSIAEVVAGYSPDFLTHPLEGERLKEMHVEEILSLSDYCDSVVIGPGLGDDEEMIEAVEKIIDRADLPMLIDADALKAVDESTDFNSPTVLTPHRGEFEMILGEEEKDENIEEKANAFVNGKSVVLVVKGVDDYITDGEEYRRNDFGNPAMTVGGTGDVLSGVIGALMSKGESAFTSARIGTYMTTRAGDKAFEEVRWGLIPEDIIEKLPTLFND
ncbi:MAG: NAD(P)H-hydrate dehydratase [Candidatus Natronoplasma sp.]